MSPSACESKYSVGLMTLCTMASGEWEVLEDEITSYDRNKVSEFEP